MSKGDPIRPVSEYCKAFDTWARVISESDDKQLQEIAENSFAIRLAISKSNLLYRLIYLGEDLRTEKCPIHKGTWSGYGNCQNDPPCNSGLDITGWLPNDDQT